MAALSFVFTDAHSSRSRFRGELQLPLAVARMIPSLGGAGAGSVLAPIFCPNEKVAQNKTAACISASRCP